MGCDSNDMDFGNNRKFDGAGDWRGKQEDTWESTVEAPTRPRLVKDEGPRIDTMTDNSRPPLTSFEQELRHLINAHSMENDSNTPDNILAMYLHSCLINFNIAIHARERW